MRHLVLSASDTQTALGPSLDPTYLENALGVPVVPQGLSSHAVGMVQLDFHFIKISLHLLLDPDGIIPAPDLSIQCALHGLHDSNVVSLQLVNFLILFSNFPVNFRLDLVQLQLDAQDLPLFMFKRCLMTARVTLAGMVVCSLLEIRMSSYFCAAITHLFSIVIEIYTMFCHWFYILLSLQLDSALEGKAFNFIFVFSVST